MSDQSNTPVNFSLTVSQVNFLITLLNRAPDQSGSWIVKNDILAQVTPQFQALNISIPE